MQATITTWRIADAYQGNDDVVAVLREIVRQHQMAFRQLGLLDIMLIRSSRETMTVVNVYQDTLDREAMLAEQNRTLGPVLAGKLELIEREYGPAWDAADILGEG
jgi:hypothetical protein